MRETGPRARTRQLLLETAMQLMQAGRVPSVTDVAEAAEVSRATAYRYFPTQAALVQAAVDEALGPILELALGAAGRARRGSRSCSPSPIRGSTSTRRRSGRRCCRRWTSGAGGGPARSATRRRSCAATAASCSTSALAPLRPQMAPAAFDRLRQSLSLIFGTEAFVVLKDIWGLDGEQARDVALWSAHALVRAAVAEAETAGRAQAARQA